LNSVPFSNSIDKNERDTDEKALFTDTKNWSLIDALEKNLSNEFASQFSTSAESCSNENSTKASYTVKLPMTSFNHIVIEVLSLERSKTFYVDILGFEIIPRPPFECEGYWLNGYGYIIFNSLIMK
jgi:hypothetical protein